MDRKTSINNLTSCLKKFFAANINIIRTPAALKRLPKSITSRKTHRSSTSALKGQFAIKSVFDPVA
jgi:hypothetical protein